MRPGSPGKPSWNVFRGFPFLRHVAPEIFPGSLGDDALENRRKHAAALHQRIERIEENLGEYLQSLHGTVRLVEQAVAAAALQAVPA